MRRDSPSSRGALLFPAVDLQRMLTAVPTFHTLPHGPVTMRTQAPRGITLVIAFVLWLVGALELLAKVELPYHVGQWALLACGALLLLGCLLRGL
jgi:hypothetical protein